MILFWGEGSFHSIVANMLDFIVSEIKLYPCYYIHFWTNTLGKAIIPHPQAIG